jgi:single-strand DNA-binding protein
MQMTGLARLGRDVEVRFTPNGDPVANLSLAFNFGKKGDDGKRPSQWVDASLWGARAEALGPYLLKGQLLGVTLDDPHTETYESNGKTGTKLVARVSAIEFAGPPPESSDGGGQQARGASQQRGQSQQRPSSGQQRGQQQSRGSNVSNDPFDEEIPF